MAVASYVLDLLNVLVNFCVIWSSLRSGFSVCGIISQVYERYIL
jgi:hypothetical protein